MRISLGSDEATELTASLAADLGKRGHAVSLHGALDPAESNAWPTVGRRVGEAVASGESNFGIVCCWTGTGVSIAANKVPGVRAALCGDAETAAGARKWNDANVLALSLRNTLSRCGAGDTGCVVHFTMHRRSARPRDDRRAGVTA